MVGPIVWDKNVGPHYFIVEILSTGYQTSSQLMISPIESGGSILEDKKKLKMIGFQLMDLYCPHIISSEPNPRRPTLAGFGLHFQARSFTGHIPNSKMESLENADQLRRFTRQVYMGEFQNGALTFGYILNQDKIKTIFQNEAFSFGYILNQDKIKTAFQNGPFKFSKYISNQYIQPKYTTGRPLSPFF